MNARKRINHYQIIAIIILALQFTFGAASHSLVMLSLYLFSIGLYGAAISISQDTKLRLSIRKTASDECLLLDSIGKARSSRKLKES